MRTQVGGKLMLHLEAARNTGNLSHSTSGRQPVTLQCQDQRGHRLEEALSEAIHECLKDILGGRAREAIYAFMEREYSVAGNELPKHLDELFTVFQQNFGVKAKDVIARAFAKKLYAKLDFEFHPIPKFEFADYLAMIKRRMAAEGT
jgi:hypothetical protein